MRSTRHCSTGQARRSAAILSARLRARRISRGSFSWRCASPSDRLTMSRRLRSLLWAATVAALAVHAAEKNAVDWKQVEPEIFEHYSNLIRIDTGNPPGNE